MFPCAASSACHPPAYSPTAGRSKRRPMQNQHAESKLSAGLHVREDGDSIEAVPFCFSIATEHLSSNPTDDTALDCSSTQS